MGTKALEVGALLADAEPPESTEAAPTGAPAPATDRKTSDDATVIECQKEIIADLRDDIEALEQRLMTERVMGMQSERQATHDLHVRLEAAIHAFLEKAESNRFRALEQRLAVAGAAGDELQEARRVVWTPVE